MISKPIALGLLAAACVTAAGGGAFLAVRQHPAVQSAEVQAQPASAPNAEPGVAESETIIAPESAAKPTAAPAPESRDAAKATAQVEPVERASAPKPSPRPASQPARSARTAGPPAAGADERYLRQQYSKSAWPRERAQSRRRAQLDSSRSIAGTRCGTGCARARDSGSASLAAQAAGRRGSGPVIFRCWTARCDVSHQRDGAR